MEYKLLELSNGIRVIHKAGSGSGITHLCFMVNTGSRDEPDTKMGLAHFLEHLLFKGTQKRNTYQILNRLEVVGGDLNAYTTKEQTCIHASFLDHQLERALELITDITFRSTFPSHELEKEKGVVLDELDSYRDVPEELIQDEFDELVFENHPLGHNILGTPESINGFTGEDINNFQLNTWSTHEMVVGVLGNVSEKKLQRLIDKYLAVITENKPSKNRLPVNGFNHRIQSIEKSISQTHCLLGGRSYTIHDPKKAGMLLLNNLLAGPGMSSRLNLEIREKFGACYTIESNYTPMSDTGVFSIYFGTDAEKTEKCLKLIHKELKKLREQPLGSLQLQQAKQRFKGQIALAEENRVAVIIAMAKSLLDYGTIDSLEEVFKKIDKVTNVELQEIANENFLPEYLNMLTYLPIE
ncbi:M16 family metallopeptidase [Solitalea koreensis]|uniref:Predicted Zn-dependent peptidase n=1 Tax=Solitalea koreensis TaxID=543615 RepID=A0A521AXL4_9SPHI|nr:pitrilysin family protein [Solitalea koreensis]SMO39556.1 Predicted Zn-dependent peptidase [Solitalea koreensis]